MGTACNEEKLLVLDVHKAQKTDAVKSKLAKYKTELVYVPSGTTGLVQPIDVVFNASFKKTVKGQATLHLQQNLHDYVQEKINATEHVYSSQNR